VNISNLRDQLFTVYAVAAMTGCGGSSWTPSAASPESGAAPLTASRAEDGAQESGPSWMQVKAGSADLLYVSDVRKVTVYSYPAGNLVGVLKHFYIASGLCVDRNGDVFVVDNGYSKIFEYRHGGTKRIATLSNPTRGPLGCSVDPTTGNLAVTSLGSASTPTVAIYKGARGAPVTYQDPAFYEFFFCGYDGNGNLFADGITSPGSGHFGLAELPQGKAKLENISLSQYIAWPGGVQWDGEHVAVGDQASPIIYQLSISNGQAVTEGETHMGSRARNVAQFWIQGSRLIAPNTIPGRGGLGSKALIYAYPAGGKALEKISKGVIAAEGAVVSLAGQ